MKFNDEGLLLPNMFSSFGASFQTFIQVYFNRDCFILNVCIKKTYMADNKVMATYT